jgi:hypothetical protein
MSDGPTPAPHFSLTVDGHPTIDLNGVTVDIPGPRWLRFTVVVVIFILSLYSFIWITEDAQRRGKSGCLAFIFLFAATWPFSLLWWLWLRPPLPKSPPPAPPPPPAPLPPKAL